MIEMNDPMVFRPAPGERVFLWVVGMKGRRIMCENEPRLIDPTEDLFDAWCDFLADFRAVGEDDISGIGSMNESCDTRAELATAVQRSRDHAKGIGMREGWGPGSTYWLVRGGRILGICNVRHRLNDFLRTYGGHVGYSIRPSERGKGYGTFQLRLALDKARDRGIERALITCDNDNLASAGVIRNNGGVFDGEGPNPNNGKITQRYWIEL